MFTLSSCSYCNVGFCIQPVLKCTIYTGNQAGNLKGIRLPGVVMVVRLSMVKKVPSSITMKTGSNININIKL